MSSIKMLASAIALCAGCAIDSAEDVATSDVLGSPGSLDPDCTLDMQLSLDQAYQLEKDALGTRAFEQCVEQGVRTGIDTVPGQHDGPYVPCANDPFASMSVDTQIQQALAVARSMNAPRMTCTGLAVGDAAPAQIHEYDNTDPEWIVWGSRLANETQFGVASDVRWIAGASLHAAMSWHGYREAICYAPGSGLGQYNTMPQIAGHCLSAVLQHSSSQSCASGTGRMLTPRYDSSLTTCATDPSLGTTQAANAVTHITTSANTNHRLTGIYDPVVDNGFVAQFTHVIKGPYTTASYIGPGAYTTRTEGDFYRPESPWEIVTTAADIPIGTGFFVRVDRGFTHRATTANALNPFISRIDNPLTNNNPGAYLQVSPSGRSGTVDPHPIGVYYDPTAQKWTVFNEDSAAIPEGSEFTVSVENQMNSGLHFVHYVTASNRNTTGGTRLSSPLLDGNPFARFLVTRDGTRGPVFDAQAFGVWYDGAYWWINSEVDGGPGAQIPVGVAFNVEVLRDEMHRFVRVAESSGLVDTGIDVTQGDVITIHAIQHVKPTAASAWVTPWGDPTVPTPGSGFPLGNVPQGELLGYLPHEGYFQIGTYLSRNGPAPYWSPYGTGWYQRLSLLTNDNVHGDGDGYFTAEVRVLR